jgi:hypothetical protein
MTNPDYSHIEFLQLRSPKQAKEYIDSLGWSPGFCSLSLLAIVTDSCDDWMTSLGSYRCRPIPSIETTLMTTWRSRCRMTQLQRSFPAYVASVSVFSVRLPTILCLRIIDIATTTAIADNKNGADGR